MIETSQRILRLTAWFSVLLLLPNGMLAQQNFAMEVYQDFRGKPPMPPEFLLEGPDLDAETKSEAAGFRITLPKTRKVNRAVQIGTTFAITGDFEITGTYELLAADFPADGYGVGVGINIGTTNDLHKFLKISRVNRAERGSVFMAEYWTKGADDWAGPMTETDVRSGQLRLVRAGATVRCQASDGPGKAFNTIFEKENFGTENIVNLRYQVTDGNKPGYAVDARLVDLRIRYGNAGAAQAAGDPAARAPVVLVQDERKADSSAKLILLLALGMMLTLTSAIALGLFFYLRPGARRQPDSNTASPAANATTFACSACGKKMKIKSISPGKRVKCPGCGHANVVPKQDEAQA